MEAVAFFGNRGIALDRGMFATEAAGQRRDAGTGGLDDVGVLLSAVGGGAASKRRLRRNAVVAASGVLAEVDLDAISLGGESTRLACGRIYLGNENPLQR
jgi:hypothetical protein